jgi:Family of unknown function (DUF5993)
VADAVSLYAPSISLRADRFFAEPAGESIIDWRITRFRDRPMEFTVLFLATAIVMLIAWRGARPLAVGLFAAVLIACVATYLHHATDALKLSF